MKYAIDITDERELDKDVNIEVYAELNRKQYNLIQNGMAEIEVPYGVTMTNKAGSKALRFHCSSRRVAKELEQGLDNSAISWQESFHEAVSG